MHFGMNGALSRSSKVSVVGRFHLVAENRRIPLQFAEVRAGVGIEQQLIRIESMAIVRIVGPVHAKAIHRPGLSVR